MKNKTDDYLFACAYIHALKEPKFENRYELFQTMRKICPNQYIIDFFELKYIYNNLKFLARTNSSPNENLNEYKDDLLSAKALLSKTQSPQLSDIYLDRVYFNKLLSTAEASNSSFLYGYAQLLIDASNLLSFCRARKQGKENHLLPDLFFQGGTFDFERVESIAESISPEEMDRFCKNFLGNYLQSAKYIPFGPEPIILFLSKQV